MDTLTTSTTAELAHLAGGLPPASQTGCLPFLQINGDPIGLDLSEHFLADELSPQTGASPSGHNLNDFVDSMIVFEPSLTVLLTSPVLVSVTSTVTLATPDVPSAHCFGFPLVHLASSPLKHTGGFPSGIDLSAHTDVSFPSEQVGKVFPAHFFAPMTSLVETPSDVSVKT